MNKKILFAIKLIISLSILAILTVRIGPSNIYNSLIQIKLFAFTAIIFLILLNLVSAINLKILLTPFKKISFLKVFHYVFFGWSLGIFTPGKMGEFSTSYYLHKKEGIPLGAATSILFLDKVITFLATAILASLGAYIFLARNFFYLVLIGIAIILISLIIFFSTSFIRDFIKKFILRKYSKYFIGFSKTFKFLLTKKKRLVSLNIIITFSKFLVSAYMTKIIFLALNVDIPIVFIIIINAAIAISTLIPISVNGLGITEILYILLFSFLGIEAATVMAHNLFLIILNYLTALSIVILLQPKK